MRAKRSIALLAIAGTLAVLVVAVLAASGERAHQAHAQAPGTETLELVNVEIVRGGLFASTWAITENSASLDTALYSHDPTWSLPRTIPPGGAQATLNVEATDKSGGRIYASTVSSATSTSTAPPAAPKCSRTPTRSPDRPRPPRPRPPRSRPAAEQTPTAWSS